MRYLLTVVSRVVVSLVVLTAAAPETQQKNIRIVSPWVTETSETRAVLHMTIANLAGRTDRLVRAKTPVTAKVAIWDQAGNEGRGLSIPGRAEFVMGTIIGNVPRIELIGLTRALHAHSSFKLMLVFEHAGEIIIDVSVEQATTKP
jgi:copper(I)-binding protein